MIALTLPLPPLRPPSSLLLWATLAVPVVAAAGLVEWWLRRRARRPLTTTEWRERMARLDLARPVASRIEGKPGVCSVERGEGDPADLAGLASPARRRRNVLAISKGTGTRGKGGRG